MAITLVAGANNGGGRETARRLVKAGHTVCRGARDAGRGRAAAAEVGGSFLQLDVTDLASVTPAPYQLPEREGQLAVLINNAGMPDNTVGEDGIDGDTALRVLDTNVAGIVRVPQASLPLSRASQNPHVVNVSNGLGSVRATTNPQRPESQTPLIVYAARMAAVAMLTLKYAQALPGIRVNAACPGLTDTDFAAGFPGAAPATEAVGVIVELATNTDDRTGTVARGPRSPSLVRSVPSRARLVRCAAMASAIGLIVAVSGCTDGGSDPDAAPTSSTTAAAPTVGLGGRAEGVCAGVPAGYVRSTESPAGSAITDEPLLSNFGVVLGQAEAVELLDVAPALTVLAPIDSALQGLPRDAYRVNLTPPRLQVLIDHHLIDTRLLIVQLTPGQTTRNGDGVVFFPEGDTAMIPADNTLLRQLPATICGTLETANATVYLIDQVLRPKRDLRDRPPICRGQKVTVAGHR